jgi:hypothetical protein
MPEISPVVNLNNMDGLHTTVFDVEAMEDEEWHAAQQVQYEDIKSHLDKSEWDRAATLVRLGDLPTYIERRVHPDIQAGKDGWTKEQIFRKPLFAAVLTGEDELVCGVLTEDNSSGTAGASEKVWQREAKIKMFLPPGIPLPKIGNRRYVHGREVFVHPDYQEALAGVDGQDVLSGIVLLGLYHSLARRWEKQRFAAYIVRGDPADATLVKLADVLNMQETQYPVKPAPGFKDGTELTRVLTPVWRATETIRDIPGLKRHLDSGRLNIVRKNDTLK